MTSKTPDYPEYEFVPSIVAANGETLASQYKNSDGTVVTDISLSEDSVARKNKLKKLLDEYESSINVFSPELEAQFENIAQAKKNEAISNFNSMYEPAVRNAREDYFDRLGTLDSTAYLDRYNALESTRGQAYADIANDYVANLEELKNNELSNRYAYLDYLQSGLNDIETQNSNYMSTINSLSSNYTNNYNNYLSSVYGKQVSNSGMNIGDFVDIAGMFANMWS